jgi:hypothetical protein
MDNEVAERTLDSWKNPKDGVAKLLAEEMVTIPSMKEIVIARWDKFELVDAFDIIRNQICEMTTRNEDIRQKWCTTRQKDTFQKSHILVWKYGLLQVLFFDILRDWFSLHYGDYRENDTTES